MIDSEDILFVGLGASAVSYYRCILPGMMLGADWVGLQGPPSKFHWATGLVKKGSEDGQPETKRPPMQDYKAIVVQQVEGDEWLRYINVLQEEGVKVIYEVDDYLHGVQGRPDHDFKAHYTSNYLAEVEKCMAACDAMIVSTDFIRSKYLRVNDNIYVCRNGIDTKRYDLTLPTRKTFNVGWAGATGHKDTVFPWLQQVANLMGMEPNTCFVSIGQGFAEWFWPHFGKERSIAVPWAAIEQYPGAMTMFDVALAPSGKGAWWKGKSDLRWLEASALGVPVIAHPQNYPDIEDGVTGFHAETPEQVFDLMYRLMKDEKLRRKVGEQAKTHVRETRSMEVMAKVWHEAIEEIVNG